VAFALIDKASIHGMEAYFHQEILSFENSGTPPWDVMLFNKHHPFSMPGQKGSCGQSTQSTANYYGIKVHKLKLNKNVAYICANFILQTL
jgi:hypothetical protein